MLGWEIQQSLVSLLSSNPYLIIVLIQGNRTGRIAKEATRERPLRTTLEIEISRFVLISASLHFFLQPLKVFLTLIYFQSLRSLQE